MVTRRTVGAVLRSMAIEQAQPLRKETPMLAKLSSVKKALATAIGMLLAVLVFFNDNLGNFIPDHYRGALVAVIAVLTPVATWLVKNEQPAVTV